MRFALFSQGMKLPRYTVGALSSDACSILPFVGKIAIINYAVRCILFPTTTLPAGDGENNNNEIMLCCLHANAFFVLVARNLVDARVMPQKKCTQQIACV